MDKVGTVCRQFQLLGEKCGLNILYSIIECNKHLYEKAILFL